MNRNELTEKEKEIILEEMVSEDSNEWEYPDDYDKHRDYGETVLVTWVSKDGVKYCFMYSEDCGMYEDTLEVF